MSIRCQEAVIHEEYSEHMFLNTTVWLFDFLEMIPLSQFCFSTWRGKGGEGISSEGVSVFLFFFILPREILAASTA